ncbi:twin-arginine translocase subunit TatC [Candidatus Halobonum tyrrellensis]|uniref:Sec-independent protein translocase protein TatC n=1 Tax=Candidatus Halobonum tyrrellensis G22 TaxID=1324957 RepID=V4GR26_9EURY|nr:twin-arginine translocase subunit TatC [Candidatus Halobonum tyrrellensis]ESP87506.1 Sec-independent periplasmic protein translocase [Candidatus Halobonum tyrrellensis G22]
MSSALDEDTQQTLAEGRETAGAMLRAAQKDLQKVFIVFVVGLMGSFYFLREIGWGFLKRVTKARLDAVAAGEVNIIAQTPFDVVLLQAKIGLAVGIILALPLFIYFARDALRERGAWPQTPVARWKLALIFLAAVGLFAVGVAYGYLVFFPFMFAFLANNALSAGIQPNYSIVKWAQFILLLTFSFGFAAQMPLAITALSYAEIIPYETFREKWRYAVVLIFVFGAFFSPPDPFTQIMWAVPLLLLYGASLYFAKVVVTARRGSERIDAGATFRRHWNVICAVAVAAAAAVYLFYAYRGPGVVNRFARYVTAYRMLPVTETSRYLLAAVAALVVALLALAYFVYAELDAAAGATGRAGDPTAIDLSALDADGVRAAPSEAFETMSEEESLAAAESAIEAGEKPKARAILDRWDEVHAGGDADPTGDAPADTGPPKDLLDSGGGLAAVRRGAGFVDWRGRFGSLWNVLLGIAVVVFAAGYALVERPGLADRLLAEFGTSAAALTAALPVAGTAALGLFAAAGLALAALLGGGLALYFAYVAGTDPDAVDIEALSADEVRRAPDAVFAGVSERRASFLADRAASAGDSAKARAVLDRYDDAEAARGARSEEGGSAAGGEGVPGAADDIGDRTSRATGTLLEGLTDGDSDEDDIGGYYEDLAFIAAALRSRAFVLVAVFGIVLVAVFASLYLGGIGVVRQAFVGRLPEQVVGPEAENFAVIVLHPVEALIFEVKISTLLAGIATLPVAAFFAWPALRERGFVRGRRGVIFGWAAALLVGLVGGLAFGAYYVAPAVISWLVGDALRAEMVISYRISDFFWLVFFTTAGIGLLVDIPVLMVLLNTAGVPYRVMRSRWREVTVGLLLVAALFTPADVITMFLVTVPLMAAYGVGLGALFVLTLGGRRDLAEPTVGAARD